MSALHPAALAGQASAGVDQATGEVTGAYVAAMVGLAIGVGVILFFAWRTHRTNTTGGRSVNLRSWRLWLGLISLAAAAIVAIVGYLQLSEEPLVNHQLPYLASAGMAVVVLSVLGGSLIVAEQVRADERKVAELEAAVAALAAAVAPAIEAPPRRAPSASS